MRSIAGSKKFAAIVVATLALGIGANTAVFGVLNAVVLRPLPYDEPERLVRVYQSTGAKTTTCRARPCWPTGNTARRSISRRSTPTARRAPT